MRKLCKVLFSRYAISAILILVEVALAIFLFISMPIVLGSLYALIPFLAYPFIIGVRIRNEEELLTAELPGYAEYKQKVKYRLIPFIW